MKKRIQVLIVDDSALARRVIQDVISTDDGLEVMATAQDPFAAADVLKTRIPDVIILDVEMPKMDGITFLKKLMKQHPIPTIICSTLAEAGSSTTMAALEAGAIDIIQKPTVGTREFFEESKVRVCDAIKAAAQARPRKVAAAPLVAHSAPKLTADAVLQRRGATKAMARTTEKIVAVGASTGGTEAVRVFLQGMPADCPGIVVVQHMPERFTTTFANRLDELCNIAVKEAQNNDPVVPGLALIAPGNRHMLLRRSGARYYVKLNDGPLVCRHRPSVDVLFRSAAEFAGANAVGVIMTGMGDDGALGMKEMKDAGAVNIAQDEASCVVFGMPAEAIKHGGVDHVLPLDLLASRVIQVCERRETKGGIGRG